MSEVSQTLPVTQVTPEEVVTLADYQLFLQAHGLTRTLYCARCQRMAEPGDGQLGWKCDCRMLMWRVQ